VEKTRFATRFLNFREKYSGINAAVNIHNLSMN
ncbi:uncharacterized protein METZ01_LOCUS321208, partial [marine metagenome]